MDDGEGQRRYEKAGAPIIPSLMVDGRVFPILHPVQIASALDLPQPEGSTDSVRLGWDAASILESWAELLPLASWKQVTQPTLSRGRSIRNLTVNTFRPYEILSETWHTRRFEWRTGEEDAKRERKITDIQKLEDFAWKIQRSWEAFLLEYEAELKASDPIIESNRGDAPYSVILRSQRWHAAFHHRQIVDSLAEGGVQVTEALDVSGFDDLDLPDAVY